jgi:hypothetical protein
MSELGQWRVAGRAALPAGALLVLGTAAALGLAVVAGFAPTPPLVQVVLTVLVAAALGVAVTAPVRAALSRWRAAHLAATGVHRRRRAAEAPAPDPHPLRVPWRRLAVVGPLAALLVLGCWVWPRGALAWLFGYGRLGLPLLPLLWLAPLPLAPLDWRLLAAPVRERRRWTLDELRRLGAGLLRWLRTRLLTRATGTVVAVLGLLHLIRGNPSIGDGGTRRAAGVAGYLIAEPLRLVFSSGGAIALLVATLACAAVVLAGHAVRLGRPAGYAVLGVALALPVAGVVTARWVGYDYYLTTQGHRVVVVAGLSPRQRHAVYDAGLALDGLAPSLRTLLTAGLPVTGRADGERIAKALAQPRTVAAGTFTGDQYDLKLGECFDFIGGSSQLRYVAPCNGSHVGEVTYVGHLPFTADPGAAAAGQAARAMCEAAYGDYLGVPYGQSFLPLEAPLLPPGLTRHAWSARPVIACWLGAVGPWALKGSKTVAALQQKVPWDSGAGCTVERPDTLRVTAATANARCVTPGPAQKLSVGGGSFTIDLEFGSIGKAAGAARVGAACLDGADLTTGYTFEVTADGIIEVWKHRGDQHTKLGASAKPKGVGGPSTATTAMQVSCKVVPGQGVELAATATGSRKVTLTDATAPLTRLSPRLLFVAAGAVPAAMSVVTFNATRL